MSRTVAIIGASPDRRKFGNKSLRAHAAAGYTVYPVHPSEPVVEGVAAYPDIASIPVAELDRITLYLPPPVLLKMLPALASKPCREVWFNPGTDTADVLQRARELGLQVVVGCSIVDLGYTPDQFPD